MLYSGVVILCTSCGDQANSSNKGGGLGALKTLALAVEQEAMREELCAKLVEEARILAVLGAEASRLGQAVVYSLPLPHLPRHWHHLVLPVVSVPITTIIQTTQNRKHNKPTDSCTAQLKAPNLSPNNARRVNGPLQ